MSRRFAAILRGRNQVPPVRTISTGNITFRLSESGNLLRFVLVIRNINRVTEAHIHLGRIGMNGPVVAFLFGPNRNGVSFRRGVIRGTLTRNDLIGPLRGLSLSNLIREFRQGNAYVNVHTIQHPDGQIRGQVFRRRDF